jgi:hypothetical protein
METRLTEPNGVAPYGWFCAARGNDPLALLRRSPDAFLLAYVVAARARWKADAFNPGRLEIGEAIVSDFESFGLTRQRFRTAIKKLSEWGFATFKSTNHSTIAKLCDSRLFFQFEPAPNQQSNQQLTSKQPATEPTVNQQLTTNKDLNIKNQKSEHPTAGLVPSRDEGGGVASATRFGERLWCLKSIPFPATEEDAISTCAGLECPKEFILLLWNQAMARGGRDAQDKQIQNFRNFVSAAWKNESKRRVAASCRKSK